MNATSKVAYSVLDLAPILAGGGAADAFTRSVDLARMAEGAGYKRYWLAEHHNIPGVASAATAVVIGHVAGRTETIRVGSGGVMLPNHAPLVIAEQFGTLESLYPGRIDLGLGRAPGGDQPTVRALRRNLGSNGDTFPADLTELLAYFRPDESARPAVRAVPGGGLDIPVYLLGSSDFSARLAGERGLPFAFASHFAPDYLLHALRLYRDHFKPSPQLSRPYVMVGVNVFVADSDQAAFRLFTSLQQMFVNLLRGVPGPMPAPVESMAGRWSAAEEAQVGRMTATSAVGGPVTVLGALEKLLALTSADELVFTAQIHDAAARLQSFELAAAIMRGINAARAVMPPLVPA